MDPGNEFLTAWLPEPEKGIRKSEEPISGDAAGDELQSDGARQLG
jgi:hypothetical protein